MKELNLQNLVLYTPQVDTRNKMWYSGSGEETTLETIYGKIKSHTRKNGSVYIGCDSQIYGEKCTFSTVICLHGADDQKGGFYFFRREKRKRNDYPTMVIRLLIEVELSIDIGYKILENNPESDIEIHIDANSKKDQPTGKLLRS